MSGSTNRLDILGDCLAELMSRISDESFRLPSRVFDYVKVIQNFGLKLHAAWHCSYSKLIALVIQLRNGVPESYDILRCDYRVSKYDLMKFFDRANGREQHSRPCFILEVNKLTYNVQEV